MLFVIKYFVESCRIKSSRDVKSFSQENGTERTAILKELNFTPIPEREISC